MGERPKGKSAFKATDLPEETQEIAREIYGVVQGEPEPGSQGTREAATGEVPRVL